MVERRHSRWYERVLYNVAFSYFLGLFIVAVLPNFIRWGYGAFQFSDDLIRNYSFLANAVAYSLNFLIIRKFKTLPNTYILPFLIPSVVFSWLSVFTVLLFIREVHFGRQVLLYGFILANMWVFLSYFLSRRFANVKLALILFGRAHELVDVINHKNIDIRILATPDLKDCRIDALIADLHEKTMPAEWQRFIAECSLAGIPVYHTEQAFESLTGRVKLDHLSENVFGALTPSAFYAMVKRTLDIVFVFVTLPLWLPILLATAIAIKIESEGSVFFIQNRVGQGDKDFRIYKLRSMCKDSEKAGAQFAQANDMRVTRVGKVIRKLRIDEIPQFFNVIKGDMSVIGPRPEQRVFVEQFKKEIPFYTYRHIVKPGITGWAQVTHGYAADVEDTQVKIEHDFYYIKHFSLWLDTLITLKTIQTVLTGFGSR